MIQKLTALMGLDKDFLNGDGFINFARGTTVPTDGTAGYGVGALFLHSDGAEGTAFYINEGTTSSCDFNAVASLTAAQEALLGATAGVGTASKAVVLDANGDLTSGELVLSDNDEGSGLSGSDNFGTSVRKIGSLFVTEIIVDLDGLNSGGTAGDIIGTADAANCHIGQITAAKNGTIFAIEMVCLQTPATGDDDIDLYSADEATGTEDTGIGALTNGTQLTNGGDLTTGSVVGFTAAPAANQYLYLVAQTGDANATYTAGILRITLYGK